jgi:hypothetical protein
MTPRPPIYGLLARFESPQALVDAAHRVHEAGYKRVDAYTPYPVEAVIEALHLHDSKVPWLVFLGGCAGAAAGYAMQYYAAVVAYPMNIAGKPMHFWPMNIPIAFEMTVLLAAFAAVFGMLALNGLPMPYHPLFNVDSFKRASQDGFFLCIEGRDPKFDRSATAKFLEGLAPAEVHEVAH